MAGGVNVYGYAYRRARGAILAKRLPCSLRLVCRGVVADSVDHDPPVSLHDHVVGSGCCRLVPACLACQHYQGGLVRFRREGWRAQIPTPSGAW
jgi:hypothetical protein